MSRLQETDQTNIRKLFDSIARRYDLANDLLSLGIHRYWKSRLVRGSDVPKSGRLLDCATGTGDITFRLTEYLDSSATVVGVDFSEEMLSIARQRSQTRRIDQTIRWDRQDIQDLPYPTDHFDAVTIAYGIRNVDDVAKAIREMARVTVSGGTINILEFGQPSGWISPFYRLYSRLCIPIIGGLVAGSTSAYRYLDRSSRSFPCGDEFIRLFTNTEQFERIQAERLTFGISWIYRGRLR